MFSQKTVILSAISSTHCTNYKHSNIMSLVNNALLILALALFPAQTIAQVCGNEPGFEYFAEGDNRSCKWFRFEEERREEYCLIGCINSACKHTCGECCVDEPDYTFKRNNGYEGNCEWVAENANRINRYCVQNATQIRNGRSVRDACPVACDYCFDDITVVDSAAPTPTKSPISSCVDDDEFTFTLPSVEEMRHCDWFKEHKNDARTRKRQERLCDEKEGGIAISSACCAACTPL